MNAKPKDFQRHFELLSDEALLATNRDDLVPVAQQCLDEEIARRGLNEPAAAGAGESGAEQAPLAQPAGLEPGDRLVPLEVAMQPEELNLARGLLESAGIPCMIANDHVGLGNFNLELRVPESMVEHAVEVLGFGISDEELAAQAEAAGFAEEEFPEDEEFEENS